MSAARVRREKPAQESSRKVRVPKRPAAYHHGSLREALLRAAERILERDGIQGLTLRAAAREAGVSHAAPKNHFGDMAGLLSDLAAVGFERIAARMEAGMRAADAPGERLKAVGRGYVAFARAHPGLFQLMYRSERLDTKWPVSICRAQCWRSRARSSAKNRKSQPACSSSKQTCATSRLAGASRWL